MPSKSSIGGTAVALSATSVPVRYNTLIRAAPSNTGVVYVGFASTVTAGTNAATDGIPLQAGDVVSIPPAKASDVTGIYVIGSTSGQKVFYDCDITGVFTMTTGTGGAISGDASAAKQDDQTSLLSDIDALLGSYDFDIGNGTDNVAGVGLLLPASGGPVAGGTSAHPFCVTDSGPTATQSVGVSGAAVVSADRHSAVANVTDAPSSGLNLVVDSVVVSVDTTMRVDLMEETSSTLILRLYMLANTSQVLRGRWKLATVDKKLQVITSVSGNVAVTATYHSE